MSEAAVGLPQVKIDAVDKSPGKSDEAHFTQALAVRAAFPVGSVLTDPGNVVSELLDRKVSAFLAVPKALVVYPIPDAPDTLEKALTPST